MPADVPSAAARGLLTSEEAAEIIGCAPRTARLLAQTGALPATRVHPRLWLFDRSEVDAFIARRCHDTEPAA